MSDNQNFKRVLGVGAFYQAVFVQRSDLVRLTASGVLPCLNYVAQLEQRPERILPPMWDLAFYVTDTCLTALKPFNLSVEFPGGGASEIYVRDSTNEHRIRIETPQAQLATAAGFVSPVHADRWVVYALLTSRLDDRHTGCLVVPYGTVVPAIYYLAYGPASKAACDEFVDKECSPVSAQAHAAGDDVLPWPWIATVDR